MARSKKSVETCESDIVLKGRKYCKVEAITTIDGRGQLVLPKGLREKANVKAGDKFAIISCGSSGKVFCITLVKADDFAESIKGMLGPMMKEIIQE